MWIYVYYGGVLTILPVIEGCGWEYSLMAAWNGLWGAIGSCWIDGWTTHVVMMPFTLQQGNILAYAPHARLTGDYMAITNFQLSAKTKRPPCCDFCCCGNKFGRIERSKYCHVHSGINRIKRTRRYVKHVERQLIQREIAEQLNDYYFFDPNMTPEQELFGVNEWSAEEYQAYGDWLNGDLDDRYLDDNYEEDYYWFYEHRNDTFYREPDDPFTQDYLPSKY